MAKTIEEAVELPRRDPRHPVRAEVNGLTVEVRAVPAASVGRSAKEILDLLDEARRQGGQRSVPSL